MTGQSYLVSSADLVEVLEKLDLVQIGVLVRAFQDNTEGMDDVTHEAFVMSLETCLENYAAIVASLPDDDDARPS